MKVTNDQLIDAIKKNAGIVSGILQTLKKEYNIEVTRNAIYDRRYKDPAIEAAFIEAEEMTADVAENRLLDAIRSGNMKAVMFYLKTKGKKRGYVERQEMTGADGKALQVSNPYAGYSDEELRNLIRSYQKEK